MKATPCSGNTIYHVDNIKRAVAFVQEHGTDVERARLRYLLTDTPPEPDLQRKFFADQRPDGGWASFWAPDYSSLDATCFRIAQAEQLGLLTHRPIGRAASFLLEQQHGAGSWEEDASVRELAPQWLRPGDLASTLYLTANCGFWLSVLHPSREGARKAAQFLESHRRSDGSLPSYPHTSWLAAGLWLRCSNAQAANAALQFLAVRMTALPASNLAWLAVTMQIAGLSPEHPLMQQAIATLLPLQDADGHWESEDGPGAAVHTTIEAVRVILYALG